MKLSEEEARRIQEWQEDIRRRIEAVKDEIKRRRYLILKYGTICPANPDPGDEGI